jgi:hypothetical protein
MSVRYNGYFSGVCEAAIQLRGLIQERNWRENVFKSNA